MPWPVNGSKKSAASPTSTAPPPGATAVRDHCANGPVARTSRTSRRGSNRPASPGNRSSSAKKSRRKSRPSPRLLRTAASGTTSATVVTPSPTGPRPTYPRLLTCSSPTPSIPATSATCAVNATRRGGDERIRPSRRATTERNPSAPTTMRALHVTGCRLPKRATTPATAPFSHTKFSTVTPSRTTAPARPAAEMRMVSNVVRGRAKLYGRGPPRNRPHMAAPQGATTFIPYSLACAEPSTASTTPPPSRSRISVVAGLKYSEHALSRGNRARSTSSTEAPARASSNAVVAPAGPAPTTTTSQRSVTRASRSGRRTMRSEHGDGRTHQRRREVHTVVVEPSPTTGKPHGLVAHCLAALEARIACGTFVLPLERRAEDGVCEHAGDAGGGEYDKPRGHAAGCKRSRQSRNARCPGHAAQCSQRSDPPRRAARHPPPGGDEARRER